MTFQARKIELIVIKTGIGEKKVKTFPSVGEGIEIRTFLVIKIGNCGKKVKPLSSVGGRN